MNRINVTSSFLPDLKEYNKYLEDIWEAKWLTNCGPLANKLEKQISNYLQTPNFSLVTNGTIAIQLLINQMELNGEVITTPFTYVATTNSILWERCKPVFVDIDPVSLCIDPAKIESKINDKTTAILGVHVFGIPCDVNAIDTIAKKHNLKVIYDAAHAFGVELNGQPISQYGDASTFSFHATKLYQMVEGGGVVCNSSELHQKIQLARVFGHENDSYLMCGINAKVSEFHAAMGLCNFTKLNDLINRNKETSFTYNSFLEGKVQRPTAGFDWKHNYSYYPVVFEAPKQREQVVHALNEEQIFPRRYFSPSLNTLPFLGETTACPISESVSERVLCLPIFYNLEKNDIERISKIVLKNL